jgi:hypothetical protein
VAHIIRSITKTLSNNYPAILLFIAVLTFFVLANLYTLVRTPKCCDQFLYVGFPIPFYDIGGIAGAASFSLIVLMLDIVIAIGVAYLVAWVATRIFKRIRTI